MITMIPPCQKQNLAQAFSALIFLMLLTSCHQKATDPEQNGPSSEPSSAEFAEILVTQQQFASASMRMENASLQLFSQKVQVNGYIKASPLGIAEVNTLIPGRIQQIYGSVGARVRRGELLFTIESNEIIMLQQEYAEAVNRLKAVKANYMRQQALAEEKVTSQKDLLNTESDYMSLQAVVDGLKARLKMIHIDPVAVENGKIAPVVNIIAPIDGYITRSEIAQGQFLETGETVIEIINSNDLQLNLYVHSNDLHRLSIGQSVYFYDPDKKDIVHHAKLSSFGKTIDAESKTILCIAELDGGESHDFINRMYVLAEIITCERQAHAVPREALIEEDGQNYLLTGQQDGNGDYFFKKVPVKVGVVTDEFVELLDPEIKNILVSGTFNLYDGG